MILDYSVQFIKIRAEPIIDSILDDFIINTEMKDNGQ